MRRSSHLARILLLALVLLSACNHKPKDAPGTPGGGSPEDAMRDSLDLLRDGKFDMFWRHALPPADFAALRRAITNWYKTRYNVELDPESEAIVTIGSKEGIAHLVLATLGRGDTVIVPNPSYPIHIYGPIIAGADVRSP